MLSPNRLVGRQMSLIQTIGYSCTKVESRRIQINYTKSLEAFLRFNESLSCCEFGSTHVLYINFTHDSIEHSTETMDEVIHKVEEYMIPLNYCSEKADVRNAPYVFNNAKSDDESYSFNLPADVTYPRHCGTNNDNLYRDMEPNQAYRIDH